MLINRRSLYFQIIIAIFSVVAIIGSLNAYAQYTSIKATLTEKMRSNIKTSIGALQKNIKSLIESYSIEEYERLILNELLDSENSAIIVEDYYMSDIVGEELYIVGKLRDESLGIVDFDPGNKQHDTVLKNSYLSISSDISADNGKEIGKITIYSTNRYLKDELQHIISNSLTNAISISMVLIVLIVLLIHYIVLKPVSNMIKILKNTDDYGVPKNIVNIKSNSEEILSLQKTVNSMLNAIKASKLNLVRRNQDLTSEIEKRKQVEEALRKSEEELRAAVDIINRSSSVAFLWKNAENWPVEFVTENVAELFGYCAEEFISSKVSYAEVIHLDDLEKVAEEVRFFSEEKGRTDFVHKPYRIITKNGDEKWIHDVTRIRRDKQGSISHYEGITYDITDRIQAEEANANIEVQLHQAKKMEAIGLLAGGVAHDLNNILSGIISYPELLLMQLPEESEMRKPLEAIQNSGERAAAVVADLLTVARGVASTKSVARLNSLVNEFLDSPECDHLRFLHPDDTWRKELADSLPNISCSPVHIEKCIMNLVTNAAEALEKSGTVTINTSSIIPDLQWCQENGMEQMEYVVLTVADTGTGISENSIEHIFEPFYSKKVLGRSGTGLGLTIVWNTLKEHNGTVTVTSSDQGTSFMLFFPVSEEAVAEPELTKKETLQGNGEKILVVDDESHLRDIAYRILDAIGYNVALTSSGEEAVAYLQDHRVDLVLLDMLMEPGINGRQTYEQIIKLHSGQKAIIASGFSESKDVKATLQLGAGGFIKKPYSMDQLGRTVKKVLNN